MMCRHCGVKRANRPRGLCHTHSFDKTIREQYPSTSKFARRGYAVSATRTQGEPTSHLPGTPEKIEVMRQRMMAGEDLIHPDDAREQAVKPGGPPDVAPKAKWQESHCTVHLSHFYLGGEG